MCLVPSQESWNIGVSYAAREVSWLNPGVSFQCPLVLVIESCLEGSLLAIIEDITFGLSFAYSQSGNLHICVVDKGSMANLGMFREGLYSPYYSKIKEEVGEKII